MANVFGILTTIVLLIAGFVAHKNKGAYEAAIADATTQQANLKASQGRFKEAQDKLAASIAERAEVDAEIVTLSEGESTQKKDNAELPQKIDTKTAEVAANKEKLDELRESIAGIGDIKSLADDMKSINGELEELSQEITSAEAKLANLTAVSTDVEANVTSKKKMFEILSNSQSLPSLNTRIRSVYPTWGFVTLAAGNTEGVVASSSLDVVRGGSVVAKLLVTTVERNSASASIVPDSLAEGASVRAGDKVVASQSAAKN